MNIKGNSSLKKYNTFGIDVKAKYFVEIYSKEELKELLLLQEYKNVPKFVLGGGSNILFTKDFDGLVITFSSGKIQIIDESDDNVFVQASAGVVWNDLVIFCVERNLGGIENLTLIPGKVGAAPIQNIGAYGQELKDVFYSLNGIFIDNLIEKVFYKDECEFAYRYSIFKKELKNKFIITDVTLKLNKHPIINTSYGSIEEELKKENLNKISIKDVSKAVAAIRMSKLPDPAKIGNAGSFFKNPEIKEEKFEELKNKFPDITGYHVSDNLVKVPAGWLIEYAGLKGKRFGNTGTHPKQALVIVNYGEAQGEEILEFKNFVKKTVLEKYDIKLEEEVNII
jgi:UDP-N-acetylmuramate dehydrogenase